MALAACLRSLTRAKNPPIASSCRYYIKSQLFVNSNCSIITESSTKNDSLVEKLEEQPLSRIKSTLDSEGLSISSNFKTHGFSWLTELNSSSLQKPNLRLMLSSTLLARLVRRSCQLRQISIHAVAYSHPSKRSTNNVSSIQSQHLDHTLGEFDITRTSAEVANKLQLGENLPRREKVKFLVSTLLDLEDSREAVYGTLDTWVAWERNFPIGPLKNVLLQLEKEQQWHRIIQVIKWILSKGQGNTMGTYEQLIRALDMDHRAKEAHMLWKKKIGSDFHSVPWRLCSLMISIYYRNNMLHDLVKLFKGLEAFDRKPPEKSIVQKVANAYEMLGLPEDKERLLEKYKELFTEKVEPKKSKSSSKKSKQSSCPDKLADTMSAG